jgi:osmotically-inducible protein OsmY
MPNDIQIQQAVIAELEKEPKVPSGCVGVEVHHGVVKLAGHSIDKIVQQQAELAAGRVDGVTTIYLDLGSAVR